MIVNLNVSQFVQSKAFPENVNVTRVPIRRQNPDRFQVSKATNKAVPRGPAGKDIYSGF